MKLIIDIPKKTFEDLRQGIFITVGETLAQRLIKYIKNGIPLDKIRAEITAIAINGQVDEHTLFIRSGQEVKKIVLEIIDRYRAGKER